jgi:protein-S-isoprenylcysteine O-methyltransferase Ste14
MILGVFTVLMGEAAIFSSMSILKWAGTFLIVNTTYFFLLEEPQLEERFGDDYRKYKKKVNRWLPRFTPYQQKESE